MPELPEVETVRKTLIKNIQGKKINRVIVLYSNMLKNIDSEKFISLLEGQTIKDIQRLGKHLIFILDDYYLLSHLRMEGKYFKRTLNSGYQKHDHIIFEFDDSKLVYNDVRKFGTMYLYSKKENIYKLEPLNKVGLEIWSKDMNEEYLKKKFHSKPIKTELLDQTIIAGIGNIYADEIMFLSKLNPYIKAKDLKSKDLRNIILNTKIVLDKAISAGGTTIRSYTSEEGISGRFQNNLLVHQKENEPCTVCSNMIIREKIGGRSTYYCPKCQKRKK